MKKRNKYKRLIAKIKAIVGSRRIPRSFSKKNNNVFSNAKHISMYVLMTKEDKSYREIIDLIDLLKKDIGLQRLPHHTTINKFALRVKPIWFNQIIDEIVRSVSTEEAVLCAIDGTGFSLNSRCKYMETLYGERKEFLKLNACFEGRLRLITALKIRLKKRHETIDAPFLMEKTAKQLNLDAFLMDKAYDSEKNHEVAKKLGTRLIAPLRKKTKQLYRIKGVNRKKLFRNFPKETYDKRTSICENGYSVLKNRYGDIIYAKKFKTQKNELLGKIIAYNLDKVIKYCCKEVYFLQQLF
jgi:hypothetical protein